MADEIFRQKSLKRISSPEELDGYIKVSRPSIWLVLVTIIILTAGFCLWGVFGRLENVVVANGTVQNGELSAVVSAGETCELESGMEVRVNGQCIGNISVVEVDSDGNFTVKIGSTGLADGNYKIEIVEESINPFYFIVN